MGLSRSSRATRSVSPRSSASRSAQRRPSVSSPLSENHEAGAASASSSSVHGTCCQPGEEDAPRVVSGGIFRAFALVRGRAAATWRLSGNDVALEPFGRLSKAERSALATEAEDVRRFLRS